MAGLWVIGFKMFGFFRCCLFVFFSFCSLSASAENLHFLNFSASKNLSSGHKLIGAFGSLHEEFEGEIAYLGVAKKMESSLVWELGYFGYFPSVNGVKGSHVEDHRIRGSLSKTFVFNNWHFMHRSRVEYRMGQVSGGFRYRPTIQLARTNLLGGLTAYAEVEPFYDFKENELTLTLLTAGVKWPVTPDVTLNIGHFNIFLNKAKTHTKGPLIGIDIKL